MTYNKVWGIWVRKKNYLIMTKVTDLLYIIEKSTEGVISMEVLILLVILGSSVWVLIDGWKYSKGRAVTWFILCLLFWIIAFPVYLFRRKKSHGVSSPSINLTDINAQEVEASQSSAESSEAGMKSKFLWAGGVLGFIASANSADLFTATRVMGHTYWEEFLLPKFTYTTGGIIAGFVVYLLYNISMNQKAGQAAPVEAIQKSGNQQPKN